MERMEQTDQPEFIVTCDIGGTNFRVRVSQILYNSDQSNKIIEGFKRITEKHYSTPKLTSFADYIDKTLES